MSQVNRVAFYGTVIATLIFADGCGQKKILSARVADLGLDLCPYETKICPDGSEVSQIAPSCSYPSCPSIASTTVTDPDTIGDGKLADNPNNGATEAYTVIECYTYDTLTPGATLPSGTTTARAKFTMNLSSTVTATGYNLVGTLFCPSSTFYSSYKKVSKTVGANTPAVAAKVCGDGFTNFTVRGAFSTISGSDPREVITLQSDPLSGETKVRFKAAITLADISTTSIQRDSSDTNNYRAWCRKLRP